jgi:hypothetical protein
MFDYLKLFLFVLDTGLDKMRDMVLNAAHLSQQLCLGIDSIPSMKRIVSTQSY